MIETNLCFGIPKNILCEQHIIVLQESILLFQGEHEIVIRGLISFLVDFQMGGGLSYGTVISYPELQFLAGRDVYPMIQRYYVQVSVDLHGLIIDQHIIDNKAG